MYIQRPEELMEWYEYLYPSVLLKIAPSFIRKWHYNKVLKIRIEQHLKITATFYSALIYEETTKAIIRDEIRSRYGQECLNTFLNTFINQKIVKL